MRKNRLLAFVAAVSLSLCAMAESFESNGLTYNIISKSEVEVAKSPRGQKYKGDIVIPKTVDGYQVTAVGEYAFSQCEELTSVKLPNSIETIRIFAFEGCPKLTKVNLPEGLLYIDDCAFYLDSLLTDVKFPETLIHIGSRAFENCTSITSVRIPKSVNSILQNPFVNCSGIKTIVVDKDNKYYDSYNGSNVIVDKSNNKLLTGCQSSVIPDGVTRIEEWAFANSGIKSVVIPNSVKTIGRNAFLACRELTDVKLPDELIRIEYETFCLCSKLKKITIPNTVTFIDNSAFWGCSSLTKIVLPSELTLMMEQVFFSSGITTLQIDAEHAPILMGAIFDDPGKVKVVVPVGCVDEYKSATYWKDFGSIVEYKEEDPSAISSMVYVMDKPNGLFTIDGRRTGEMNSRGIYVKDGRKILKR